MAVIEGRERRIVGGVDTHKDLHVAAVVDEQDRVIETRCFATTRQGYRQMLAWMRSFGDLQRIGIEFDRQLWRGPPPFHAASRNCGSRGHHSRQAGSPPAWQERRSRCSERGPCRFCRPADRDAAKPGRDDRIPAGSHGGIVTRTVALLGSAGKMAYDDLVCPPSVPTRDHPARRLAVCAFHAELSRRGRSARGARFGCLLRDGAAMGLEIRAGVRSRASP